MENCENCGTKIGNLETPRLFQGTHIVCENCYEKLGKVHVLTNEDLVTSVRQIRGEFVDHFAVPRMIAFILAIAVAFFETIYASEGGTPDFKIDLILWGIWLVFGLISMAKKSEWRSRR